MRVFTRVQKHVATHLQQLYTTCDICGEPVNEGHYEHNEIAVRAHIGNIYPEDDGDPRNTILADFCRPCFELRVRPALTAIGVRFREFKESLDNEPKVVDGVIES